MEINRLRWACRRGMLEVDLVLMPFLENEYQHLSEDDKHLFEQLLESEDQDLFAWFLKKEEPQSEDMKSIVRLINEKTGM